MHTYTEITTEVFSELLELIFWRLSTRQIEIVFRESFYVCLLVYGIPSNLVFCLN